MLYSMSSRSPVPVLGNGQGAYIAKRRLELLTMEEDAMNAATVLITGGSSGIGLALAHLFAADGYRLILVALEDEDLWRAKDELTSAYGIEALALGIDLAAPNAPPAVHARISDHGWPVDVLVNCAGVGSYGAFNATGLNHEYRMIAIYCGALMALTKLFLPAMLERRKGRILNFASTTAFQPTAHMAVYSGTKAFIHNFSLALRHELRGHGVTVTTVYPYATRSNFGRAAHMEGHPIFQDRFASDPDEVARAAYRAMKAGKARLILPHGSSLEYDGIYRLMPLTWRIALVKWWMRS
ncbi:MAG: SDR family oxidoreductase [Anaerolineales bacterium]|nr:SDR family oxidoreductase [Anaerolineales bacterium]